MPLAELTAWPLQDARYHEVRICGDREWSREIPDPPRTQSTQSRRHCRHTLLRAANHQPATCVGFYSCKSGRTATGCDQSFEGDRACVEPTAFRRYCLPVVHCRRTQSFSSARRPLFCDSFFGEWTPICGNGPRTTRSPLHIGCTCRRICPGLDQCARNPHTDWRLRSRSRPGLSNPGV